MAEAWEEEAASWVEEAESEDALAQFLVYPAARRGLRCTVRSISIHLNSLVVSMLGLPRQLHIKSRSLPADVSLFLGDKHQNNGCFQK